METTHEDWMRQRKGEGAGTGEHASEVEPKVETE